VPRYTVMNVFVATLSDGLARADDHLEDVDDANDESRSVREPNFLAPGELVRACALAQLILKRRNTCESQISSSWS
jgi:hypothetical protein